MSESGFYAILILILGILAKLFWTQKKLENVENKLINETLEKKEKENELNIEKKYNGKSDVDIVRDAIKRGSRDQ